ncbi:UNVERIFIED_CONTAM: hypothetical protein Sradi_5701100 [Sesamum radiatum]|uniref:Uncharacterized protein n=1 Tax=Sesamum radiatum TaxID=300843 RepID=A0AAW2L2W5_SESRA
MVKLVMLGCETPAFASMTTSTDWQQGVMIKASGPSLSLLDIPAGMKTALAAIVSYL